MYAMPKLAERILAVIRPRRSFGSRLAGAINLSVCGVVTYLALRSPAEGGSLSTESPNPTTAVPLLEPHAWQHAVGTILVILGVLTAWTHGQRILAACLDVLADVILDSRRASGHLGMSLDRLIGATRRFVGFSNEKKPLGRRPPPRTTPTPRTRSK